MTYFELYEMPISFQVDKATLQKKFHTLSRKFHPDFYTLEGEEKQAEVLELSSLNNKAYKTLTDFDKRMQYILEIKGILGEEGKNGLPNDFLMEMMDFNEQLMELEFGFDAALFDQLKKELTQKESALYEDVQADIETYDDEADNTAVLKKIKIFYLKRKYFLRIKKSLSIFASL